MPRRLFLSVASLSFIACLGTSGGSGNGNGKNGGGSDSLGGGVTEGIPCGQILDCYALCDDGDDGCYQSCYDDADPYSQEIMDELDDCFGDNGCTDWWCMQESCPSELDACEQDVPDGGMVCFAEGTYEICDGYSCWEEQAFGAGWGINTEAAEFWGTYDCTEFMSSMVAISSYKGSAGVVSSCVVSECGPN